MQDIKSYESPSLDKIVKITNYHSVNIYAESLMKTIGSEKNNQGMTMSTTFTVSSIANGVVTLDVSGKVSGAGTGSIKGKTTFDISSGVPTIATLEVTISAQ